MCSSDLHDQRAHRDEPERGFTLLYPSLALLVIDRSDEAERGAALGAYTSFWDLGLGVAGLVTGAVATGFGYEAVFLIAALAALASATVGRLAR